VAVPTIAKALTSVLQSLLDVQPISNLLHLCALNSLWQLIRYLRWRHHHRRRLPPPPPPSSSVFISVDNSFLREFAKLRKAIISCGLSVCLSVRMEQLGPHWTNFYEIRYSNIFRKSVEKIEVSLKSVKNNGYFTWRCLYVSGNISLISS
jgi:hypothetical protein